METMWVYVACFPRTDSFSDEKQMSDESDEDVRFLRASLAVTGFRRCGKVRTLRVWLGVNTRRNVHHLDVWSEKRRNSFRTLNSLARNTAPCNESFSDHRMITPRGGRHISNVLIQQSTQPQSSGRSALLLCSTYDSIMALKRLGQPSARLIALASALLELALSARESVDDTTNFVPNLETIRVWMQGETVFWSLEPRTSYAMGR